MVSLVAHANNHNWHLAFIARTVATVFILLVRP